MEYSIFIPILLIILIAVIIGIFLHTEKEKEKLRKQENEVVSFTTHQLRTPIAILRGYVSLMLDEGYGEVPRELKHPLSVLLRSSEHLSVLVEEYRDVSSMNQGKIIMRCIDIDVESFIREITEELQPQIQRKKHALRTIVAHDIPKVCIDAGKIRQVIHAIIENALEYTPEGTTIALEVRYANSQLIIDISDSGPGVSEEERDVIFNKYQRGKVGETSGKGTGLGLFIARTLVRSHGGDIWVTRSRKYGGATFRIEIPIA